MERFKRDRVSLDDSDNHGEQDGGEWDSAGEWKHKLSLSLPPSWRFRSVRNPHFNILKALLVALPWRSFVVGSWLMAMARWLDLC